MRHKLTIYVIPHSTKTNSSCGAIKYSALFSVITTISSTLIVLD
ncbi:hypothetical protein [Balneola sp. EhC07]|nr:hypothetical protein [Balneola sp. EhC07]